jgi:hypothetical protein
MFYSSAVAHMLRIDLMQSFQIILQFKSDVCINFGVYFVHLSFFVFGLSNEYEKGLVRVYHKVCDYLIKPENASIRWSLILQNM